MNKMRLLSALSLVLIIGLFLFSCEKPKTEIKEKAVKTYQADEFFSMVSDKSRRDVETLLGKPFKTEKRGEMEFLFYDVKVIEKNGRAFAPKIQFTKDEAVAVSLMPYEKHPAPHRPPIWER